MIELTQLQRRELQEQEPLPIDPDTKQTYVLVRAEVYERIRDLLDDDGPDMHQVAILVDQAMREDDADDPTLEYYQKKYGKNS